MWIELTLYLTIATAGLAPLLFWARRPGGPVAVLGGVLVCAAAAAALLWHPRDPQPPADERPTQIRDGTAAPARGFVSSDTCRSCHADQYRSWYDSYHRTMTQVVSPETVVADFDDVTLEHPTPGRPGTETYRAERRGDAFFVEVPDPESEGDGGRTWRQIVMSTGLHHYQLYWYPTGSGRQLHMFPFVYLESEERWVPRGSVFLKPPKMPDSPTDWNFDCLPCHTTDGQPRFVKQGDEWVYDSQVAEMGISCEACHGPGEEHIETHQSPLRRYRAHFSSEADPTITQPERLSGVAASQVCGQCHSVNIPRSREGATDWVRSGPSYRAGQDLFVSRYVIRRYPEPDEPMPAFAAAMHEANPAAMDQWFWPDGQLRVTGRELNGVLDSPCYEGGEYSCLSCHSLHDGPPDDQLREGMRGDRACLQCHESFAASIEEHTHHPADSSGSRCYNCHMPHTTYGLLKATRSHTVENPSAAVSLATGRPTGCNVCHLDRTLAWTADSLSKWYGQPPVPLPEEERRLSGAALALLRGDAGERALAAWALGWEDAREASAPGWIVPLLAHALDDPYDTVRYVAVRSLRRQPGFEGFEYDFVGPPEERREAVGRVLARWEDTGWGTGTVPPGVLLEADGEPQHGLVQQLVAARDDRPMVLAE